LELICTSEFFKKAEIAQAAFLLINIINMKKIGVEEVPEDLF